MCVGETETLGRMLIVLSFLIAGQTAESVFFYLYLWIYIFFFFLFPLFYIFQSQNLAKINKQNIIQRFRTDIHFMDLNIALF